MTGFAQCSRQSHYGKVVSWSKTPCQCDCLESLNTINVFLHFRLALTRTLSGCMSSLCTQSYQILIKKEVINLKKPSGHSSIGPYIIRTTALADHLARFKVHKTNCTTFKKIIATIFPLFVLGTRVPMCELCYLVCFLRKQNQTMYTLKGTPLRSGRVTQFKRF